MVYLQYRLRPDPCSLKNSHRGETRVRCWLRSGDIESAENLVEARIVSSGWVKQKLESATLVDRSSYANDADLAYFDRAEAEGEAYTFEACDE